SAYELLSYLGPDGSERGEADVRIGEQLIGAPLPAVAIDGEAAFDGFVRRERESLQQCFAIGECLRLRGEGCSALGADAACGETKRREALIGVVGAEREAVLGAAG